MLKTWWKIIRTIVIAVGVLLTFFAVIEIIRAYQTLYLLHPIAGYAFLAVLLGLLLWLIVYLAVALASRPAALVPPDEPASESPTPRQARRFANYLVKYLNRLAVNTVLTEPQRQTAQAAADKLKTDISSEPDVLRAAIEQTEQETIVPLLDSLDAQAEKEIRVCVAVVMAGVTLSPYKAADLMIVVYRNITMVARLIRIYNTRPRLTQQFHIAMDIINIIATVNYINMGKNLIEHLGSKVPGIGSFIDDIAQGIGAGFMTSVTGHAAIYRCRAYRRFSTEQAKDTLRSRIGGFYADVRDMFNKDILPQITRRIGDTSKDTIEKIASAIDETGSIIGKFVKAPFNAASTAVDYSKKKTLHIFRRKSSI
ncbi:MAG: DUF697 domain-containing protein [Anaerohalosphaera sp.]|nr:DUF697 domain-containing protein [Anaerohalosphaera sp.]